MSVFDEVKKDFDKRNALGWELYKKELMPDDGVDWLLNAYEECLDLCVYLKGQLLARDAGRRDTVGQQRVEPHGTAINVQSKERQSIAVTNSHRREEK